MAKCIYCEKTDNQVTFIGREHVIPRLMGTFKNNLKLLKGSVCDICNSKVFNPLETRFKEDTEEGIYYQMFNFQNSCQIRIRGNNVKTTFSPGLGDDFFNEMFPFFKRQDNNWRIFLLPQIKIKRYGDIGYLILLIEELKKIKNKEFLEIKKLLTGVQSKDISIFTDCNSDADDEPLKEAIDILKRLGVKYKEGKRKFVQIDKTDPKKQFEVSMECTVNKDVARVIAKIAFNYFAYCAINENNTDLLFHPHFARIKAYILNNFDLTIKQVIRKLENKPIIYEETVNNMRFIGHTVVFCEDSGNLIARVSFLGKRIYTIVLGKIPDEVNNVNFGCGHLFDPINQDIHQLTQDPRKWGSDLATGFGLFKRL